MNSVSLAEHKHTNVRPIHRMLSTFEKPHYSVRKSIQFTIWNIQMHTEQRNDLSTGMYGR
jgi:hypothetical protein